MDNFRFDITYEGDMTKAMEIAFRGRKATSYRISPAKGLVFYWGGAGPDNISEITLPFSLDAVGAADFATRWLAEQNYGPQPDHDGDNGRGWRIYNEAWGHVGGSPYAIIAIKPAWAMYGK